MKYFSLIAIFVLSVLIAHAQSHNYFTNETLRIDFTLSGNNSETHASIFELKKEPFWGGSPISEDKFEYGEFKIIVKDSTQQNILFSRGFCTLFEEWQATSEAKYIDKSFQQTVVCPFPKYKIAVSIEKRKKNGEFYELLSTIINPLDYSIIKPSTPKTKTHKLVDNGSAEECVDIVFIGDGYIKEDMKKFHNDVIKLTNYLFTQPPFDKLKAKFNIWAIDAISDDSGMTDPRKDIWKNTALKSSFNTLNSDRYLESTHTFLIRDYAGLVPYDQIYVIANTEKYGGGGIYNHFSLTSVDNKKSLTVFVHEFGHSFAGLGDEYYTSSTSYNDFFNQEIEPWQPNLTTMVNLDNKWKKMIKKSTPVPTPASENYYDKVGAFEGGGYTAKGIFRPAYDCRMKTNEAEGFCPVCQKAIKEMVKFLIGK
jgi:hypothetical protein